MPFAEWIQQLWWSDDLWPDQVVISFAKLGLLFVLETGSSLPTSAREQGWSVQRFSRGSEVNLAACAKVMAA